MTEESQVRELLARAAEVPDLAPPPIGRLIDSGRRVRRRYRLIAAVSAAFVVAAAVATPTALRLSTQAGARGPGRPATGARVPLAATLAGLQRDHWSQLPSSPLNVSGPQIMWTGSELIQYGGTGPASFSKRGAAYVPGVGWHLIAPMPASLAAIVRNENGVWTGRQLIVFCRDGARAGLYDPATNSWSVISFPLPTGTDSSLSAAAIGQRIIVADATNGRVQVASYNLGDRTWHDFAQPPRAPGRVGDVVIAAAGGRMVLWSMWGGQGRSGRSDAAVLSLASGKWRPLAAWPQEVLADGAQEAGGSIMAVGRKATVSESAEVLIDIATLAVREVPAPPLGVPTGLGAIWTGGVVLAFEASPERSHVIMSDGPILTRIAAWDPATGRWRDLPARVKVVSPSSVWTGRALLTMGLPTTLYSLGS